MSFAPPIYGPIWNPLTEMRLDTRGTRRFHGADPFAFHGSVGPWSRIRSMAASAAADIVTPAPAGVVPMQRQGETSSAFPGAIIPLPASTFVSEPPPSNRGIFLTAYSIKNESFRQKSVDRLKENDGDIVIFDVKGSAVHFDADNLPIADKLGLHKPQYELQEVLDFLKANNVRAIARFIAIKDQSLAKVRPDTQLENPRTGSVLSPGYVDPSDPLVLDYNAEVICALASAGVEEINLDYIRYRTEAAGSLSVFTKDEKVDKILAFVKSAREAIDRCGPDTKLGISTFSVLGWDHDANVNGIGQDIRQLAPLVDVISPMAYNANFSLENPNWAAPAGHKGGRWHWLVYRTLIGYKELIGEENAYKLRPWLQGWGVTTAEMRKQMEAVYDAGACGFMVWSAGNEYAASYAAMDAVPVPENCR